MHFTLLSEWLAPSAHYWLHIAGISICRNLNYCRMHRATKGNSKKCSTKSSILPSLEISRNECDTWEVLWLITLWILTMEAKRRLPCGSKLQILLGALSGFSGLDLTFPFVLRRLSIKALACNISLVDFAALLCQTIRQHDWIVGAQTNLDFSFWEMQLDIQMLGPDRSVKCQALIVCYFALDFVFGKT